MEKTLIKKYCCLIILIIVGSLTMNFAQAATLYTSPAKGSYSVGKNFSVGVYVSSSEQSMNGTSGVITFPSNLLEVTSLVKSGSIISLWVQDPTFSNANGKVNFEGVVLNPGFKGSSGKILTITFRVKAAGSGTISLSSGSVLANDGEGSNILKGLGKSQFNFTDSSLPPSQEPAPAPIVTTKDTPSSPQVTSLTHPNPDKWYQNTSPVFSWILPNDINGVRLLVDQSSNSTPSIITSDLINTKQVDNLTDGIWYFHAQFRNTKGWGNISHSIFKIDSQPPKQFTLAFPQGAISDNPSPLVSFKTTDDLSGVSHYEMKIADSDFYKIDSQAIESGLYNLPLQTPGKKTLIVKAIDNAGNETTAVSEFEVLPITPPDITRYQTILSSNEALSIAGTTFSNSLVTLMLKNEKNEIEKYEVKSSKEGLFEFIWPHSLARGTYALTATVVDDRGAQSLESEPKFIKARYPIFLTVGDKVISILVIIIPLLALLILLVFMLFYSWHKLKVFRQKFGKQSPVNDSAMIYKAFILLQNSIKNQIKVFDAIKRSRSLTKEEIKIVTSLNKDLLTSQKITSIKSNKTTKTNKNKATRI